MTLKRFELCNLPYGAVRGIVPGGEVNRDNMKIQLGEINISYNKEDIKE